MNTEQAEAVWQVLQDTCDAGEDRYGFVHHQTQRFETEWRFQGALGFGGKFWRTNTVRPDMSWGERWYVNCYREDETSERLAMIENANARLWELQQEFAICAPKDGDW